MRDEMLQEAMRIDDRSSGSLMACNGREWRLVSDQVMGGRSAGELTVEHHLGRDCLRLHGNVSTANNGGFLQMALDLAAGGRFDATAFSGLRLQVAGNDESYNLHLRTSDLWMPWQSYRAGFVANAGWQELRVPFEILQPWRTRSRFNPARLVRIGLVAIGRQFEADLYLADVRFYTERADT